MKLLHLSDTHGQHHALKQLPDADIVIHSGDFTFAGAKQEAMDFMNWFCDLPHKYKIFIAGNHDGCIIDGNVEGLPDNVYFLNNSSVTIEGLKIYGMPMFMEYILTGEDVKYIEAIHLDSDIVITHQPPSNILDFSGNTHYGSQILREKITSIAPKYHLFGHIHDEYGEIEKNGIIFSNASVLDEKYNLVNVPRLFDLKI